MAATKLMILQKELERQQTVRRFLKLELSRENELQDIVKLAAEVCKTPIALITLIDEDTQHIRFKVGVDQDKTSRKNAFCDYVIRDNKLTLVEDARQDVRFAENPLVTGQPYIRFYAGSPLITSDGHNLGSLCVISQQPSQLSEHQLQMLQILAKQVTNLLEFEASLQLVKNQYTELTRTTLELRSFFESSIDCHLLLGKNFELLAFNKAAERHIQINANLQLVKGKEMGYYLNADHRELFYADYHKALKGTAAFAQRKLTYEEADIWWLIKMEPAFNELGDIIGVSVNATDITARMHHQEKSTLQNELLQRIAHIQSHEFRRPVASIMGLMNVINLNDDLKDVEELMLMRQAVDELDEKIRLIVTYAN